MKTLTIKNPSNGKTTSVRANGNESLYISKATAMRVLRDIGATNPLDCFVDGDETLHVDGLAGFPPRASHAANEAIGEDLRKYLAYIGRKGGSAKSEAKAAAVRANGKRGGRPRNTDDCRVRVAGHVYTASYVPADGECPECWTVQPDYGDWDRDPDREEALEAIADKLTKRWRSPWIVEYSDSTIVRG